MHQVLQNVMLDLLWQPSSYKCDDTFYQETLQALAFLVPDKPFINDMLVELLERSLKNNEKDVVYVIAFMGPFEATNPALGSNQMHVANTKRYN